MSHPDKSSAIAGFTLLEVLVAMVLLSVGVLGLQALSVTAIRSNAQARVQTTQATALAAELETTLYALRFGTDPADITTGTNCTEGHAGETCVTVAAVDGLTSATQRVYSVEATLTPTGVGQPMTMTTVIYAPIPQGGGGGDQ